MPPGEGVAFGSEPRDAGVLNMFCHAFNEQISGATRSCRSRDDFHETCRASLPACVNWLPCRSARWTDSPVRQITGFRELPLWKGGGVFRPLIPYFRCQNISTGGSTCQLEFRLSRGALSRKDAHFDSASRGHVRFSPSMGFIKAEPRTPRGRILRDRRGTGR